MREAWALGEGAGRRPLEAGAAYLPQKGFRRFSGFERPEHIDGVALLGSVAGGGAGANAHEEDNREIMSKTAKAKQKRKGRDRRARRVQAPTLRKWALWGAMAAAVAGAGLSLYATNLTFEIARQGVIDPSGCSINDWINCDVAHASSYAMFLGVPVAWWGFLFYLWTALATFYAVRTSNKEGAAGAVAVAWVLSLGAVLFSIYKAYHLMTLGVLCLVCVGMYAANLAIAVLLPQALNLSLKDAGSFLSNYVKELTGKPSGLNFSPRPARFGLLLVALFGLGFIGIKGYEGNAVQRQKLDLDRVLKAHFRPTPVPIEPTPDAPVWGNPDAPITIIEFADFQCPACRESAFHLRSALFEFRDDVALYFMNFPLDNTINTNLQRQIHMQAGPAARAAVCAQEFGDFWSYHDDLFRDQPRLGRNLFLKLAADRGWDMDAFAQCLDGDASLERVKRDVEAGMNISVPSTPSIFVNGRRMSYWRNTDFVRAVIREELSRIEP